MVNHPRSFARRETPMPKVSPYPLSHLVSAVTVVGGQANIMQGTVHLVLFAVFIFLAIIP